MKEIEIMSYFMEMSLGLLYMHSFGIAHGNLKLSNIMIKDIGGKNLLKLADFETCSIDISRMKETMSL